MLDNEFVHIKLNCCNELICCTFIKVICISPTYELALQTGQVAEKMGKFCPEVKIGYAVRGERGEKLEPRKIIMHKRVQILVFLSYLVRQKVKCQYF